MEFSERDPHYCTVRGTVHCSHWPESACCSCLETMMAACSRAYRPGPLSAASIEAFLKTRSAP